MKMRHQLLGSALVLTGAMAFANTSPSASTSAPASNTNASTGMAAPQMSDAQIAQTMKTANDAEIDAAKLAKSRTDNKAVKDFALHMIDEHKTNNKEAKKTAKKEDIKPEWSDFSKNLKKDAQAKMDDLKKLKGAEFDKAYIDSQVEMHQQLLTELDQNFIPTAKDPQFKSLLEETRGHVSQHLDEAKKIQSSMLSATLPADSSPEQSTAPASDTP